jgi:hypothetical protein
MCHMNKFYILLFFWISSIFYEVDESMCCLFYLHCFLTELGYVLSNRVLHDIQCRHHQFQIVPVLFQLLVVFWRRLVSDYMLLLCLNSYHAVKRNLTTSITSLRASFTMGQGGKLILQWPKSVFRNSVRLMAWKVLCGSDKSPHHWGAKKYISELWFKEIEETHFHFIEL